MDLALVYGGLLVAAGMVLSPLVTILFNSVVIPFFNGNPQISGGVRLVLLALDSSRAIWPQYFNDPSVSWDDFVLLIGREALEGEDLTPSEVEAIIAEAKRVFSPAFAVFGEKK